MKCLCGFQHLPNSAPLLASHLNECMIDGVFTDPSKLPVVVWRDGGFSVVREAEEGEQTYDIGITRHPLYVEETVSVVVDTVEPVVEEETNASE